MPSLRDLRRRIRSVQNTEKITKAMELVAAARMRRALDRVLAARPYSDEITSIMTELMKRNPEYKHPFLERRDVRRRILILVTADRGLVGALNGNNTRLALREMNASGVPVDVITMGRKGREVMRRLHRNLIADRSDLGARPGLNDVLPAARVAMDQYISGDADQIDIVYARYVSAGRQEATLRRLIPVEPPEESAGQPVADFEYEPEAKDVLDALLPRYVEALVYQAELENVASEQAAKMVAMRNASDNARDLITDLTLTANNVRQSQITTELMEIVGGAAALEG
jgi:F-type H+-transporting ATPase subunit gamma